MRTTTAISAVGESQPIDKVRQRRQIAVLVAFILVGAAVFSLWQSYLGLLQRQQVHEDHALQGVLATARVVDRETSAAGHLLRTLSTSPALAKGDLATFYEQMRAASPKQAWLILNDADGQLLNTSRPYGSPLTAATSYDWTHDEEVGEIRKRRLWVSDRLYGPISRAYSVAVSARVDGADGEMKYILSLVMADPQLREIGGQYQRPDAAPIAIYDRKFDVVVAGQGDTQLGSSDIELVRSHVQRGERSGTIRTGWLLDRPRVLAFAVASDSGWTAVAQRSLSPLADLLVSSRLQVIGISLASLFLTALGCALIANRWFDRPIETLRRGW